MSLLIRGTDFTSPSVWTQARVILPASTRDIAVLRRISEPRPPRVRQASSGRSRGFRSNPVGQWSLPSAAFVCLFLAVLALDGRAQEAPGVDLRPLNAEEKARLARHSGVPITLREVTESWRERARQAFERGDDESAEQFLSMLELAGVKDPSIEREHALALYELGEHRRAKARLHYLLRESPHDAQLAHALGMCHSMPGSA